MNERKRTYLNIFLALSLLLISVALPYLHNHTTLDEDISCPAYIYVHSFSGEIIYPESNLCAPEQTSIYPLENINLPLVDPIIRLHASRAPPFVVFG